MNNADIFLDKYKQLEEVVKSTYKLNGKDNQDSVARYLENQNRFKAFKDEIEYCREVRNLLAHKKKINNDFAVVPSERMIEFIDTLIEKVRSRTKCLSIAIDLPHVFWQDLNGNVKDTMKMMQQKLYTHVPILENGVVVGVFDENSVFNYLADEEIVCVDDNLTFEDIKSFLSLADREMEEFIFIGRNCYVDELEEKIEQAFHRGKRIGLAFITENGKATQKMQGIITPWDIISAKDYNLN